MNQVVIEPQAGPPGGGAAAPPASPAPQSWAPRPKLKAGAGASAVVIVLTAVARLLGLDPDEVPAEVLEAVTLLAGAVAAYVWKDGLAGTWDRIVHGERVE